MFADRQTPIGCGGVTILPDDVIVAYQDGAVVVPWALVQTVCDLGREGETLREWILEKANAGRKLPGLSSPDKATKAQFEAWRQRGGEDQ